MKRTILLLLALLLTGYKSYSQVKPDSLMADPVHLEAFFDGLMNGHLRSKQVAGAVVAVVKDGKAIFTRGYGYSDVERKQPVSPDSTLFRIGSISKTFTWIAVMQLVEQGKLNLDEDVNKYLTGFKIPSGDGGPVTLRHLMTHTPGFEDRLVGIFSDDAKSLRPYGEILKEQLPERVRPAGTEMSYSNHGSAMAAYIVEQVSGLSWCDYAEQHIIQPLGMDHTTFRQPLPGNLSGMLSKGYNYEDGRLKEYGFEYIPLSAVGGASSTAADMSRYMITQLQSGRLEKVRILDSLQFSRMQKVEFRVSPFVSGIGLGLYELANWNGIRTVGHGGDTFWFHSLMALIPEKNFGLFLSFNSQQADYAQVFSLFMDHISPLSAPRREIKLTSEQAEKYTGAFRFNRYPHSDLTRIISMTGLVNFRYDTSGCLRSKAGDEQKWLMVNDTTFLKEDGQEYLVFGKEDQGRFTRAYFGNLAVMPLERLPWTDAVGLHLFLLVSCLIVFVMTLIYWPAAYFIRSKYKPDRGARKSLPANVKWLGLGISFVVFLFFMLVMAGLSNPFEIFYGVPPVIKTALILPLILCLLALISVYQAYKLGRLKGIRPSGKIHFYVLIIALFLLLWQLNHWNFLGFNY